MILSLIIWFLHLIVIDSIKYMVSHIRRYSKPKKKKKKCIALGLCVVSPTLFQQTDIGAQWKAIRD